MRWILFFFVFFAHTANCQDITPSSVRSAYEALPKSNGQYDYTESVKADPGIFKIDKLYKNAKSYFANAFKNSQGQLLYAQIEKGKVFGNGNLHVTGEQTVYGFTFVDMWNVSYDIEFYLKEGAYTFTIHNVKINSQVLTSQPGQWDKVSSYSISLKDAFQKTQDGITTKMSGEMFMAIIDKLKENIEEIRKFMSVIPN